MNEWMSEWTYDERLLHIFGEGGIACGKKGGWRFKNSLSFNL